MNRYKKAIILLLLLAALVMVYRLPRREMAGTEALEVLLQTAGAGVVEGEVQFYAILDEEFRTMEELEDILLDVAERIGLVGGDVQYGEEETFRVLDVTGETAFGPETHIVVQSNPGGEDAGLHAQTYLLVVCRDTSVDNIDTIVARLRQELEPEMPQGQLSYYLTGELSGKLTTTEMEALANKALSAVRGRIVEGMWDDDLISITAYTPLVDRYLTVDGERFNLNIAVRYDDYHEKTILWAGFPLIHGSY